MTHSRHSLNVCGVTECVNNQRSYGRVRGSWGRDLRSGTLEAWVCLCTNMHLGGETYREFREEWWPNPKTLKPWDNLLNGRGDFPLWSTGQFPELSVLGFAGRWGGDLDSSPFAHHDGRDPREGSHNGDPHPWER